ncbi:hypothetical protein LUZ61_010015 [Rhynchospora tenuis]|uniref:Ethylene receptor n=1 Tax=Rhynchospora tenuis TaxID=198213 RepID=A0AAD5ZYG2_9POAL|nr:hypothetical protein LUZ61_010015 [Rhynchospora tenuis]
MIVRVLSHTLLLSSFFFFSVSAIDIGLGLGRCNCDAWDLVSWSVESILQWQKVSDFLIAAAYFSIPLELLYFASCANLFPFKWIVLQFGAFIVLCGLTHLLTVFTYEPHSFLLVLSLTVAKFMTALVSFATTITLLTLIPQLLRIKVRENFLRIKAKELDREVVLMKRQEEASWHVRMLTHEIRKSLDRHTILYTTMVELSKTLNLQNCAVWMPNENRKEMILTHQLVERSSPSDPYSHSIPIDDPDVIEIKESNQAKILKSDSVLGLASSGSDALEPGPVAAIRMPMLRVSNFKGGTPEIIQARYAILVLVLPRESYCNWSDQELDIVEVVADQVAVALSHASVLEESQLMREKLEEQNRILLQAQQEAMRASAARSSFQITMSEGMRRPMHSIVGLLSMLQMERLKPEQRLVVDAIAKTSLVVSTLVNDVMDMTTLQQEHFSLVMRPFDLSSMVKEAVSVTRCLCDSRDIRFEFRIEDSLPEKVIGDEKRVFHVILHMVGTLVNSCNGGGLVNFSVLGFDGSQDMGGQEWVPWKSNISDGYICVKFEVGVKKSENATAGSWPSSGQLLGRPGSEASEMGLSFNMCKKLVQMMNGNIWSASSSDGSLKILTLVLKFQRQLIPPVSLAPSGSGSTELGRASSNTPSFKGLRVLLADEDASNRVVTRKLLEKLGCRVCAVASGTQCLTSLSAGATPFQLLILDLNMKKVDGFEVSNRIRKFRSGCWPLIVALTAGAEENVWEKCVQSGINGLIRKPVTLTGLADELYRVLQNT